MAGSGAGADMGLQGSSIQSPFLGGLVALPSLAQSQLILEVAAITAVGEALMHEASFTVEVSLPLFFGPPSATRSCLLLVINMITCIARSKQMTGITYSAIKVWKSPGMVSRLCQFGAASVI